MFDIQKMMKQMQEAQKRMQAMQAEMEATELVGTAGGGAVTIVANGKMDFKSVKISPEAAGDAGMLEDLMMTALKDLSDKANQLTQEKMGQITGGMNIPGMKLPF